MLLIWESYKSNLDYFLELWKLSVFIPEYPSFSLLSLNLRIFPCRIHLRLTGFLYVSLFWHSCFLLFPGTMLGITAARGRCSFSYWNIQSQKPEREGGRQNPKFTCNRKQKNQRRDWFVLLTKLSKISVSKPVFLSQGFCRKQGITAGWGEAEVCGWLVKDTACAGDTAHPPGKWLQVHRVQKCLCYSCAASGTGEPDSSKQRSHGESWTADKGEGFSWSVADAQSTKPHQHGFLLVPTALLSHHFPPGSHPRAEAAEVHRGCPGKLECRKWNKDRSYPKAVPKLLVLTADQNGAQVKNREADSRGRAGVQTQTGQQLRRELLSVQGGDKGLP